MLKLSKYLRSTSLITLIFFSAEASAASVDNVKAMLKKAVEMGNEAAFESVLQMALETWPADRVSILSAADGLKKEWLEPTQIQEIVEAEEAKVAAEEASRARGFIYYVDPVLWNGQVDLGAGASTGDTEENTFSIGLSFHRKFGPKWEHDLDLDFDLTNSEGVTKRERFVAKYEATWRPWKSAFLLNFTELELDRFSGYDYRIVENIGVGFDLIKGKRHDLSIEGGPGLRFSKEKLTGNSDTEFLGRVAFKYDWKISDSFKLRDRMSVIWATESTTVENDLRLTAKLNSHLSARLNFKTRYDTNPPLNTSAWDTLTRASLVYDF